jgi:hypothetical protein
MSRGKYSPNCKSWPTGYEYRFNCYGKEPEPWTKEMIDAGAVFDANTMLGDYDENGYDRYGYSCFDSENNLVGFGEGIDIEGFTESDYLSLNDLSSYERATYYD